MKTKDFILSIQNCEIGFMYNKLQLFQYLLWDKIVENEQRIAIIVSIDVTDEMLPVLIFKRLKLNKAHGNFLSLDLYNDKIPPKCRYYDMNAHREISPNDMILDTNIIEINLDNERDDLDKKFHKSLFMINQLKVIKEFSSDDILISGAYINYMNSAFYPKLNHKDRHWFTLKMEGNFASNFNYKLNEDDGTHLPIIEVGSPCPPMWHDGIRTS